MAIIVVLACLVAVALGHPFDGKIINGNLGKIENFPYQVSIGIQGNHFCGGSILDSTTILTAAHCFDAEILELVDYVTVRAGSSDSTKGGQLVYLRSLIVHEGYNKGTPQDKDIAVLSLATPLKLGLGVMPVTLETRAMSANTRCTTSGWGTTDPAVQKPVQMLRYTTLDYIDSDTCKKFYGRRITDGMLCTLTKNTDACQGDSGGPLVANGKLVGVVSWGIGCAEPTHPGVFTDVSKYLAWISAARQALKM